MMSYKVFITDWISELGRYAIITAAFQVPKTEHYAAECFVFALDAKPFFTSKRITYRFDPVKVGLADASEPYMQSEALEHAKNLIGLERAKAYKHTKNMDVYRAERDPRECDSCFVVFGDIRTRYESKLKELAKTSESVALRKILNQFLNLTIMIEPIK